MEHRSVNKSILKRIWTIFTTVVVLLAVLLAVLLVGVRLFGMQLYIVQSGSMEPEYQTGSLIYVKEKDVDELVEGDVITFHLSQDIIATHRIVEVIKEDGNVNYRTKGDANDTVDGSLVNEKDVIGTPVATIPYLGYFVNYIQQPPGKYIAISVGAAILLFILLGDQFFEEKKKKE